MPTPFGPDHYSRDWNLLRGVADEWDRVRAQFGWGAEPRTDAILEKLDYIFGGNPPRFPNLKRLQTELFSDPMLARRLCIIFYSVSDRCGYRFREVLSTVLLRILCIVMRNARTWLNNRQPSDQHWARFWNNENLAEELRRACHDLKSKEQTFPFPSGRGGVHPDFPEHQEALLDLLHLLDVCTKNFTKREAAAFRYWYHNTGEGDTETETEIARRLGLSLPELNELIRRAERNCRHALTGRLVTTVTSGTTP